jgi:tRNA wybutosine-synthesizing protein 4
LVSKLSAANLGYFTDPYLKFFVRKSNRRSPLINRGYYSRVAAVAKLMRDFLNAGGKQIVSLGAGYDSSYFRLKASGQAFRKYFEVDFPDVCIRKSGLIRKYASPLLDIIEGRPVDPAALAAEPKHSPFQAAPKQNAENASSTAAPSHTAAGPIYVSGPDYVLLEADLRSIEQLESNLVTAGVDFSEPTLFLSECVLVYMKGEESGVLFLVNLSFMLI